MTFKKMNNGVEIRTHLPQQYAPNCTNSENDLHKCDDGFQHNPFSHRITLFHIDENLPKISMLHFVKTKGQIPPVL
jgi:hypothetical protein